MTIQAQLSDGTILEFPDGTKPEVIQRTVKGIIAQQKQQPVSSPIDMAQPQQLLQQQKPKPQFEGPEVELQRLAAEQGPMESGFISMGRGLAKIGRALGFVDHETETEKKAFEALEREQPIATTVGEVVGESLPFAAVPIGAIPGTVARVATATGLGALEGGLIRRGEGASETKQLTGAGIGGSIAGISEAVLPVIGRISGRLIKKYLGKTPTGPFLNAQGTPTEELQAALERAGIDFTDLKDAAIEIISSAPGGSDPRGLARRAFLEGQGFVADAAPTAAQVTRDPTLFQTQMELAKSTNAVRKRLESQQGLIVNRFDDTIAGTGGQAVTSGQPVVDAVTNKITRLDNKISDMYKLARERTDNKPVVQLNRFFAELRRRKGDDDLTGGFISSIEGVAKERGILDQETGAFTNVSVEQAEKFVQSINRRYKGTNDFGKLISRELKDAIDFDVAKSGGEDLFKKARQEKAKLEAQLRTVGASRRSKRTKSLVNDIIEEKVNPEDFINDAVLKKSVRSKELSDLKKFLTIGDADDVRSGTQAWNDLRAETMDFIKNKSFIGAENADGIKELSRTQLEKILNRIGKEKLSVLFNPDEVLFLENMLKVAKLLEPVQRTAIGKGPSAQAIQNAKDSLMRRVSSIPGAQTALSAFEDVVFDPARGVLAARPVVRRRNLPIKSRIKQDIQKALPLPAVAGMVSTEEDNINP